MTKLNSINPADGSIVGSVKITSPKDVIKTVNKAKQAFKKWENISIKKRVIYIRKFTKELMRQKRELAKSITLEVGKPYKEAMEEVDFAREHLEYYIKEASKFFQDKNVSNICSTQTGKITFEPYGTSTVITPWNFPLGIPILGIIPNILVGNTVIFKPSEETPLTGKMIINIFKKIGLPAGVVNVIYGDGKIGRKLVDSPVDFIWFTGSSKVGHEIYKKCGFKFIRCLLELGGSSPGVVFADADLDKAVKDVVISRFFNCGQVCNAVKRLFVEEKIFPIFVKKLVGRVSNMKIGHPFSGADIGPLVSEKQLRLLISQVNDAVKKGAKIEIGGKRLKEKQYKKGNFFLPTVVTNVDFKMRLLKEEVFGPVLPVISFEKMDQVIEMANNTSYGLSAEIYTSDLAKAQKLAKELEVGSVSINTFSDLPPDAPFGGYKMSGIGRQGGQFGFWNLCQMKYIHIEN